MIQCDDLGVLSSVLVILKVIFASRRTNSHQRVYQEGRCYQLSLTINLIVYHKYKDLYGTKLVCSLIPRLEFLISHLTNVFQEFGWETGWNSQARDFSRQKCKWAINGSYCNENAVLMVSWTSYTVTYSSRSCSATRMEERIGWISTCYAIKFLHFFFFIFSSKVQKIRKKEVFKK